MRARIWSIEAFVAFVVIAAAAPTSRAIDKPKPGSVIAVVNGKKITGADLNVILDQMGPSPVKISDENQKVVYEQALSMLIDDLLIHDYLSRYVPRPPKTAIDPKIEEMKAGLKKSGRSFEDYLRETKQSEQHVRDSLAHVLQWSAFGKKYVSDAHLKEYYNRYRDFFDRVVVRASHVYLQPPPGADPAKHETVKTKLRNLRVQILEKKLDFATAAKLHSVCPSAKDGGDIGTFPRKFVVDEEFARVAFGLKVGDVSDVVKTDFGYHIIQVTERKPGTPSSFEKIKEDVRDVYLEDYRHDLLQKLRKSAKIDVRLD